GGVFRMREGQESGMLLGDASFACFRQQQCEPVGLSKRQGIEDERLENGEDGDVGTDADGERKYRNGREAWTLPEVAAGESQVLREFVEYAQATRFPALFFDALNGTEFHTRRAFSLRARRTRAHLIFDVVPDMQTHFGVHLVFH